MSSNIYYNVHSMNDFIQFMTEKLSENGITNALARANIERKHLVVVVENDEGILSYGNLSGWINPKMNRYRKVQNKHKDGKWNSVYLDRPLNGTDLCDLIDNYERLGIRFVFAKTGYAGNVAIKYELNDGVF